jgi:hypothetical protein
MLPSDGWRRLRTIAYGAAMLYEVHVPNPDGSLDRFFVNRQERVRKGDIIEQMTLAYTVRHIEPGTGEVDHVLEVELSPAQAELQGS